MKLDCGNCVVRNWRRSDKADLLRFADNRNVWRNLTHAFPHPYTETDAEQWFFLLEGMPEPTHWAIEVDGQAAGGIGVVLGQGVYRKSATFGYWLGEPYWGRGIMTEVVKHVSRYAMSRYGLVRLHSAVFEWNHASMRVLEKCGFSREGVCRASVVKEGKVIDSVIYGLVT
jgi:[ribosomal protein S5]-alanine N-acetyltransferase